MLLLGNVAIWQHRDKNKQLDLSRCLVRAWGRKRELVQGLASQLQWMAFNKDSISSSYLGAED